jgi:hypothetical protein
LSLLELILDAGTFLETIDGVECLEGERRAA